MRKNKDAPTPQEYAGLVDKTTRDGKAASEQKTGPQSARVESGKTEPPKEAAEPTAPETPKPDVPDRILRILHSILTGQNEVCEISDEDSKPASISVWCDRLSLRPSSAFLGIVSKMPEFFRAIPVRGGDGRSRMQYIFTGRSKFLEMMEDKPVK